MCLKLAEKHGDVVAPIDAGARRAILTGGIALAGGRKPSNFTES